MDEGEEVLPADADGDDDGEEEAASVDDLGLPMPVLAVDEALELLASGELRARRAGSGRPPTTRCCAWSAGGGLEAACIYKPVMGERPLGDFPDDTLARREVAAFLVSRRRPAGTSCRRRCCARARSARAWSSSGSRPIRAVDPVALVVEEDPRLRRMAVFDAAVNNTDRKAGPPGPGARRPRLRRRPRRDVLAGAQAADRALGVARPAVQRRGAGGPARPSGTDSTGPWARRCARCWTRSRCARRRGGSTGS